MRALPVTKALVRRNARALAALEKIKNTLEQDPESGVTAEDLAFRWDSEAEAEEEEEDDELTGMSDDESYLAAARAHVAVLGPAIVPPGAGQAAARAARGRARHRLHGRARLEGRGSGVGEPRRFALVQQVQTPVSWDRGHTFWVWRTEKESGVCLGLSVCICAPLH